LTNQTPITNLNNIPKKQWSSIYHNLNSWEWDDRLGDKPERWDNMPDFYKGPFASIKNIFLDTKFETLKPIMNYIRLCIGERELLHYNNVVVLGKTEDEFREWLDNYLLESKE